MNNDSDEHRANFVISESLRIYGDFVSPVEHKTKLVDRLTQVDRDEFVVEYLRSTKNSLQSTGSNRFSEKEGQLGQLGQLGQPSQLGQPTISYLLTYDLDVKDKFLCLIAESPLSIKKAARKINITPQAMFKWPLDAWQASGFVDKDTSGRYTLGKQGIAYLAKMAENYRAQEAAKEAEERLAQQKVNETKGRIQYLVDYIRNDPDKTAILYEATTSGTTLTIDLDDMSIDNFEMVDHIIENHNEAIQEARTALNQFDLEPEVVRTIDIRFTGFCVPECSVAHIRSHKHLGKLRRIVGVTYQKSEISPHITTARYECPACGNVIEIAQHGTELIEPKKCGGCGRKGKFSVLSQQMQDMQALTLEELPAHLGQRTEASRVHAMLHGEMCVPENQHTLNAGEIVQMTGVLKDMPKVGKRGGTKRERQLVFDVTSLQPLKEGFDLEATDEDIQQIQEVISQAKDPLTPVVESFAPHIAARDLFKISILVSAASSHPNTNLGFRANTHVGLVGDGSTGKSELMKCMHRLIPRSRLASAETASGVGLTASTIRDEFLGGWSTRPGLLALSHNSVAFLDELDKLNRDDRSSLHGALENGRVRVTKAAGIVDLPAECSVVAAMNPRYGRFDDTQSLMDQIDLPPTLIQRFDLLVAQRDRSDVKADEMIFDGLSANVRDKKKEVSLSELQVAKLITYCQRLHPTMEMDQIKLLKQYWLKQRKEGKIVARQAQGLFRIASSLARLRLSETITTDDVKRAIGIHEQALSSLEGLVSGSVEEIITGGSHKHRDDDQKIKEWFKDRKWGSVQELKEYTGWEKDRVQRALHRLNNAGDIMESRQGMYQRGG